MPNQKNSRNRREEFIEGSLQQFMEKGLFNTSIKDLGRALEVQPSILYYYFQNKDEIVIACAEQAAVRIEKVLILPVLDSLNENLNLDMVRSKMTEVTPMMKFFAQVCSSSEYREAMQPALERMRERYFAYGAGLAKRLSCEPEDVTPYLGACVAVVSNYMIFGESFYFNKPIELIVKAIGAFKEGKMNKNIVRGHE